MTGNWQSITILVVVSGCLGVIIGPWIGVTLDWACVPIALTQSLQIPLYSPGSWFRGAISISEGVNSHRHTKPTAAVTDHGWSASLAHG